MRIARPLLAAVALAALVCAFLAPPRLGHAADGDETPGIRRVVLPPERIAAELERAQQGGLHLMPRDEFEDLVRGATRPPREPIVLVAATYRAKLIGADLVGSGEWTIRNPNRSAGLMSIEPLQLALRKVRWSDGQPAFLGPLSPRASALGNELLVERGGDRTLNIDWSARGVAEPPGTRFDLRIPACSIAALELDLPADRALAPPRDGSVTSGPLPGPAADRRLWRLNLGRSTELDLTVLPAARDSSGPPAILARQRNRFEPSAAQIQCEFAFDLDVLRGSAREFVIDCEPTFQPLEVTVRNLDRWEVKGDQDGRRSRVAVRLHDAIAAGSLTIRGFMPLPVDRRWVAPRATLMGAIRRGETIAVRFAPDIVPEDWRSGSFTMLESSGVPDRNQTIVLQSSLFGASEDRPSALLRVRSERIRVHERMWWSVETGQSTLLAQLSIEPVQGVVASIPLRIPRGWTVDRVESLPADTLESWHVESTEQSSSVSVELARPIAAGHRAELRIALTQRPANPGTHGNLPWPDVEPVGAAERSGFIALRLGPDWRVRPQAAPVATNLKPEDRSASPWGSAEPVALTTLPRGPLNGMVELERQTGRVSVSGHCDVEIWPGRTSVRRRLEITPTGGLDRVILMESNHGAGGSEWRATKGSARVKSNEPIAIGTLLPILAAGDVRSALAAAAPWGESRCIQLTESIAEPLELESLLIVPNEPANTPSISLPRVLGTDPVEWRVSILLHPGVNLDCRADGEVLTDVRRDENGRRLVSATGRIAELQFAPGKSVNRSATLVQALLMVDATETGRLKHELTVDAWNNREASIAIDLPAGAERARARINNKDVTIATKTDRDDGGTTIELPLPSANDRLRILVEYIVPESHGVFGGALAAAMPALPGASIRTIWRLPDGVEPVAGDRWVSSVDANSDRDRARIWVGEGSPADCIVRVVNLSAGQTLSLAFAAIVILVGMLFDPRTTGRWAFVAGLGLALATLAVPSPIGGLVRWPLLALAILVIRSWVRGQSASHSENGSWRPQVVAISLAAGLWLGALGRAAPPPPVIVYIVPAAQDSKGREKVLAPLGLAERLREAAKNAPAPDSVAAIAASYRGKVLGGVAQIQSTLELHAFGDGPTPFVLPLGIANLQDIRLDGKPALPAPNGDRLSILVTGRGVHVLDTEFSVPCPIAGEREVRFPIPELPQCRLTFAAPRGVEHLRAIAWRGAQEVVNNDSETRLEADLGRVGVVHLRWTQDAAARPATVRAQEACLWDFQDSSIRLLASTRWTMENASVTVLEIEVPDELEIASVSARPVDLPAGATPPGWLQSWRIIGSTGAHRLRLTFSAPISGIWQSTCEFVPREQFATTFTLPFPAAHGVVARESAYAWRSRRGHFTPARLQGVAELPVESFQKDFWLPAKAEPDPRPANAAYMRTRSAGAPVIRLTASRTKPTATGAIEWTIGPTGSDIVCHCHYAARDDKIGLCEWEVAPTVQIIDVVSPDLLMWNRSGNRLQIWLQKAAGETEVHWTGSIVADASPASRFDLPIVRALDVNYEGTLRAVGRPGFKLTPTGLRQLELRPGTGSSGREWEYRVLGSDVRGTLRLAPVDSPVEAQPAPSPPKRERADRTPAAPVECLLADISRTPMSDRRWLHSARFMLRGSWPNGLRIAWPEPVRAYELRVDQVRHRPPEGAVTVIALPAHPAAESRCLRVTWVDGDANARPVRPNVPRLTADDQAIEPKTVLWTVAVPADLSIADAPPTLSHEEQTRLRFAARMPADANAATSAFCRLLTWELKSGSDPTLRWATPASSGGSKTVRGLAILALAAAGVWASRRWGRAIWPELTATIALGGWLATGGFVWLIPLSLAGIARASGFRDRAEGPASAPSAVP